MLVMEWLIIIFAVFVPYIGLHHQDIDWHVTLCSFTGIQLFEWIYRGLRARTHYLTNLSKMSF